jgi:hypothetical protein
VAVAQHPVPATQVERDRIIGVGMAALLVRMNTGRHRDGWVHIRLERLSLVDVLAIRREVTLDFTYPVWLAPVEHMTELTTPLLPLTLLTKSARLTGFTVQDEQTNHLSVLTRIESATEASRCLVGVARTVAEMRSVLLPPEIELAFERLAPMPGPDACDLLGRMRRRAEQVAPEAQAQRLFGPAVRSGME